MDMFLWWSGAVTWGVLAFFGILALIDLTAEYVINQWGFRREFLAFVWERLKARKGYVDREITTPKSGSERE